MAALAGWRVRAREADTRVLAVALTASVLLHLAFLLGLPQWVAREHMVILPGPLRARIEPSAPPPLAAPRKEEPRAPVREPAAAPPPESARAVRKPVSRAPATPAQDETRAPATPARDDTRGPAPSVTAPLKPLPPEPAGAAPVASPAERPPQGATRGATKPSAERATPAPREAVAAAAPAPSAEEASTVAQYRIALMEAARAFRSYPRLARENNWQGRVTVRLEVAPGGVASALAVASSSGYPVLDQQAIEMIRRAQAKTPVPAALRAREFSVEIPVIFDLRDE